MKNYLILVLIFCASLEVNAQKEIYNRATISLEGQSISNLAGAGIDIMEGIYIKDISFTSDFSEGELAKIKQLGFHYTIDIQDVSSFYKIQAGTTENKTASSQCNTTVPTYSIPANFHLGTMGGYFTYDEMLVILDSMNLLYPNLITIKQGIPGGTSIEGDSILWVKISDNPLIDEAEPEVLYSALHHAREPGGLSALIYYMWYVLENYTNDPSIQALVNNTEMYFVPCMNPDGYKWNEITDPNGGGMWRKNRRDNLDGSYGVDLNRNYGYNWGYDDFGSSPFTSDATYRGASPFSEPETQLMRDFVNARTFGTALNYHTYGNLLVYPWGNIAGLLTPDSIQYETYGNLLTQYNDFKAGTADQTVGYVVNGNSDDWMYGEQSIKPKVFAFTPEVGDGAFGFWPPATDIQHYCDINMYPNILSAKLAGPYAVATVNNQGWVNTINDYIHFTLLQLGVDTTGTYTVSLTGLSSTISSTGNAILFSNLSPIERLTDSISFALNPTIQFGDTIRFLLSVNNGLYTESDTITTFYGNQTSIFNDPFTTTTNWGGGTNWGLATNYFISPPSSMTDSPLGNYPDNSTNTLLKTAPISLGNAIDARLTFYARWLIEYTNDYCVVEISNNNGSTWTPLCGNYTNNSINPNVYLEPVYDGFQPNWVFETISLNDYIGQTIRIRFRMESDFSTNYDGFYFDDLDLSVLTLTGISSTLPVDMSSSAYPNPATDYITINYPGTIKKGILEIFSVTGNLIERKDLIMNASSIEYNVRSCSNGIYSYRITEATGEMIYGRFAVTH